MKVRVGFALLLLPRLASAANGLLTWEYPVDLQASVTYDATVTSVVTGVLAQQDAPIVPMARADCQVRLALQGETWTPETLCAEVCLPVGETTVTMTARRQEERSRPSNASHATLTSACRPDGAPSAPPTKTTLPGWAIGVGAVAISGAAVASQSGTPSLPSLVNRQCVSWKITGPCLCNPTTPCLSVEYFEPTHLIEVVKQPGTTTIPVLGTLLKAGLSALGVSLFGGGGSGSSAGAGMTNLDYAEVHVWSFPQVLGGPCTKCAPVNAIPVLHYASEADAPAWRTSTAPLGIAPPVLLPVGVWGMLFPRTGFVIHSSPPVAAALRAFRAVNIASLPVTLLPAPEAHVIISPALGITGCLQMASPKQTPCFPVGTPGTVWEQGAVSATGSYVFLLWRKQVCCTEPPGTCGITLPGVGGQGENLCPL